MRAHVGKRVHVYARRCGNVGGRACTRVHTRARRPIIALERTCTRVHRRARVCMHSRRCACTSILGDSSARACVRTRAHVCTWVHVRPPSLPCLCAQAFARVSCSCTHAEGEGEEGGREKGRDGERAGDGGGMKCAGERRRGIRGGGVGSWAFVGLTPWTRQSSFQIIQNVLVTKDEEQDSALREQHAFSRQLPQCRRGLDHSAAQVLVPEDCWGGGRGAGWRGVLESCTLCTSTRFSLWCLRVACSETRNALYFFGSCELQNLQNYTLCICLVLASCTLCSSTRFSFCCLRVSCSVTRNVLDFDGSGELQNLQKYTLCICLILASYALCISARFVFWLNEVQ